MKSVSFFVHCSVLFFASVSGEAISAQSAASARKPRIVCITDAKGVTHPALEHSSGYRELDQAALASAKAQQSCSPGRQKVTPAPNVTEHGTTRIS